MGRKHKDINKTKAQSTVEYFLILISIILVTGIIISRTSFFNDVKGSCEGMFDKAHNKMIKGIIADYEH